MDNNNQNLNSEDGNFTYGDIDGIRNTSERDPNFWKDWGGVEAENNSRWKGEPINEGEKKLFSSLSEKDQTEFIKKYEEQNANYLNLPEKFNDALLSPNHISSRDTIDNSWQQRWDDLKVKNDTGSINSDKYKELMGMLVDERAYLKQTDPKYKNIMDAEDRARDNFEVDKEWSGVIENELSELKSVRDNNSSPSINVQEQQLEAPLP